MTVTIEPMSDSHYGSMYASPPPWPPQGAPTGGHTVSRPLRWPTYVALLMAFLAIGVATASWFRTPRIESAPPKSFTTQEVQEAKANVCEAYGKVVRLINVVTNKDAGGDAAAAYAIVVNARLAGHVGGEYLSAALEANPATPPELAEAARKLSRAYHEMVIDQIGNAPKEETSPLAQAIDEGAAEMSRQCK